MGLAAGLAGSARLTALGVDKDFKLIAEMTGQPHPGLLPGRRPCRKICKFRPEKLQADRAIT